MRNWIARYSTHRIGISRVSAEGLFGKQARETSAVLYYGFDFGPFLQPQDPYEMKRQLGIPQHRKVVGHVGRFLPVKNHTFIVECFQRIVAAGAPAKVRKLLAGRAAEWIAHSTSDSLAQAQAYRRDNIGDPDTHDVKSSTRRKRGAVTV